MSYSKNVLGLKVLDSVSFLEKGTALTIELFNNEACIRPATSNDTVVGIALEDYTRGVDNLNGDRISVSIIEFSPGIAGVNIQAGNLLSVNDSGKFIVSTKNILGVAITNGKLGELFQFVRVFSKEGSGSSGGVSSVNSMTGDVVLTPNDIFNNDFESLYHVLPSEIFNLTEASTSQEISDIIGGVAGFTALSKAIKSKKIIAIYEDGTQAIASYTANMSSDGIVGNIMLKFMVGETSFTVGIANMEVAGDFKCFNATNELQTKLIAGEGINIDTDIISLSLETAINTSTPSGVSNLICSITNMSDLFLVVALSFKVTVDFSNFYIPLSKAVLKKMGAGVYPVVYNDQVKGQRTVGLNRGNDNSLYVSSWNGNFTQNILINLNTVIALNP